MREARAEKETIHMKNEETSVATVAEQGANGGRQKPVSKKRASEKTSAPKAQRSAKSKKPAKTPIKKSASERSNKKAEVIALMKRAKGVTLAEIVEVTSWQKHTIRGFVSLLGSKGGQKIDSSKNAAG